MAVSQDATGLGEKVEIFDKLSTYHLCSKMHYLSEKNLAFENTMNKVTF